MLTPTTKIAHLAKAIISSCNPNFHSDNTFVNTNHNKSAIETEPNDTGILNVFHVWQFHFTTWLGDCAQGRDRRSVHSAADERLESANARSA